MMTFNRVLVSFAAGIYLGVAAPDAAHAQADPGSRDTDTRNAVIMRSFPQCSGTRFLPVPQATVPVRLDKTYVLRWMDARRDSSADIQVPGLGDWQGRRGRVREVMSTYFHVHYGEKDGQEAHYCLPYEAISTLNVIARSNGNIYQIILSEPWLHQD